MVISPSKDDKDNVADRSGFQVIHGGIDETAAEDQCLYPEHQPA